MKNIKSTIMTVLLFVVLSFSQNMVIYKNNGTVESIYLQEIDSIMFDTTGSVMRDIDGNVYKTIKIGNQCWMAENLRVTHYNGGTPIPISIPRIDNWYSATSGAMCWYNGDSTTYAKTYGAIYNWYVLAHIAPVGWHVPTDGDWRELEDYLIANGYNYDSTTTGSKIAKSMASQTDWNSSTNTGAIGNDLSKNNASGFNAFPGGSRNTSGEFINIGNDACWWSYDEYTPLGRGLHYSFPYFFSYGNNHKQTGFSVRLIRDRCTQESYERVGHTAQ